MKHERYLNMQAFRLRKSNITTRRCFGLKTMLKQVNQKRTELMFMFEFFLPTHNIFMEDKTHGSFHYFPHNVVHSPLKIVIINRVILKSLANDSVKNMVLESNCNLEIGK